MNVMEKETCMKCRLKQRKWITWCTSTHPQYCGGGFVGPTLCRGKVPAVHSFVFIIQNSTGLSPIFKSDYLCPECISAFPNRQNHVRRDSAAWMHKRQKGTYAHQNRDRENFRLPIKSDKIRQSFLVFLGISRNHYVQNILVRHGRGM